MTKQEVISAIRRHCVECMGGQVNEVTTCPCSPDKEYSCELWPFRMGKDPKPSEARREAARRRAKEDDSFGFKPATGT